MLKSRYLKHALSALCLIFPLLAGAQTTEGTDFWVTFLQADQDNNNSLALSLTISSRYNCNVTISHPFTDFSQNVSVTANENKIVQLYSGSVICDDARTAQQGTGKVCYSFKSEKADSSALHIVSDQPISLFASSYKKATFDATNVLPTSTLQDDYIIQTYSPSDHGMSNTSQGSHFAVVAAEDGVVVDYYPTVATKKFNDVQVKKNNGYVLTAEDSLYLTFTPKTKVSSPVLNRGEVFYVWTGKADWTSGDLSGTRVTARNGKKIAVFQGCPHTNIPYNVKQRDHIFSQAMPTKTWGNTFVLTSSQGRKRDIYRILALNDGTEVYWGDSLVHTFDFTVDTKQYWEFEIGDANVTCKTKNVPTSGTLPAPLVVGNNAYIHTSCPCAVHQFLASQEYDSSSDGDPAMVWINPVEQQIDQITFSTFQSNNGTTYHYANIVTAFPAGMTLDGTDISSDFSPVAGNNTYYFARKSLGTSADSHTLKAAQGGFIAHVYGFTDNESYAYSAGGSAKSLEQYITINGEIFSADTKNTLCGKDTIHFACDLNYDIENISWFFGDGTSESGKTKTAVDHYYAKTGTYQAYVLVERESSNLCQGQLAVDSIPIEVTIGKLEFSVVDTVNDICASRQLRLYYENTGTKLTTQNCTFSFNQQAQNAGINSLQMANDEKGMCFLLTIPEGAPQGDGYSFTIDINTGCGDTTVNVGFTLPLDPNSLVKQLWDNILVVKNAEDNGGYDFVAFQWFKNGELMEGENAQMLDLHGVVDTEGEYVVRMTTATGEIIETCPYLFKHQDVAQAKDGEFSYGDYDEIRAITMQAGERIYISTTAEGTADLYDITGNKIGDTLQFGKDGGFITLPKERGIYILRVATPNEKRNFKVYVL